MNEMGDRAAKTVLIKTLLIISLGAALMTAMLLAYLWRNQVQLAQSDELVTKGIAGLFSMSPETPPLAVGNAWVSFATSIMTLLISIGSGIGGIAMFNRNATKDRLELEKLRLEILELKSNRATDIKDEHP